ADFTPITHATKAALFGAGSGGHEHSLGFLGAAGDDVDNAVNGVGSPQGGPGAADDFNALNIFEHGPLHIPEDAGEKGCIDAASVLEDEEFVGEDVIETAGTDGPFAGVQPGNFHSGDQAQGFLNSGDAGAADILFGDHRDGGRR